MRNQTKHLLIIVSIFSLFVGNFGQSAHAQDEQNSNITEAVELDQAHIDQLLAPIALYPDTLLSHILVASTYPLEVIQAARWRAANEDLNEQQALEAAENKDWDPSVQALVPFNDLLQSLSEDLDWLQSLGSAFLVNEQQILSSVQNLRKKAYQQGNLTNNDYVNVEHEQDQIVIETVRREVVYVPYYDTRVVYGNWWWHDAQPYFWNRPRHSIFNAGLYWSIGFNIRPSFYFGGFHWNNRHVVANYHYRSNHANRHWSNAHGDRRVVRVKDYPRWDHNQQHRRGAQYRYKGQGIVRSINKGHKSKGYQQVDKQRVLNVKDYANKHQRQDVKKFKQTSANQQHSYRDTKTVKNANRVHNKQRVINQSNNQQRQRVDNNSQGHKSEKYAAKSNDSRKSQRHEPATRQNNNQQRAVVRQQESKNTYRSNNKSSQKNSHKSNGYRAKTSSHNKSRPVKVARHNKSKSEHR